MPTAPNNHTDLKFRYNVLDIYGVRLAILKSLTMYLQGVEGILLDVGCGRMPYKDIILSNPKVSKYIGLDLEVSTIHDTHKADLLWDGTRIPLPDNAVDCAIATEVFEHCFDIESVLKEIYRVVKSGGTLFFTVPFLWPLHEVPFDACRYTPFALNRYLIQAGFSNVDIKALGGWNASLAQMLGLWVRRRPQSRLKRYFLSQLLLPLVRHLYKADKPPQSFKESTMITGLYGVAVK